MWAFHVLLECQRIFLLQVMKMSPIFGCNNFSNTEQHFSSLGTSVDVVKYELDEARSTRCEWHCAEGAGCLETRGSPGEGDLCPVSHRPLRSHVTARHKTVVWRLAIDIKTWKNLKAFQHTETRHIKREPRFSISPRTG